MTSVLSLIAKRKVLHYWLYVGVWKVECNLVSIMLYFLSSEVLQAKILITEVVILLHTSFFHIRSEW